MIDPCSLPETGWGWLALVTVSLTLLGLGVAFVALPRRSWMALVGAAAMAVVGIGGATSVDAQTDEECYSIRVYNAGHGDEVNPTRAPNIGVLKVCEIAEQQFSQSITPTGVPAVVSDNCVEFPVGSAVGAKRYLELRSALSGVAIVTPVNAGYGKAGLWGFEPTAEQVSYMEYTDDSHQACGEPGNGEGYAIGNGDLIWIGSSTLPSNECGEE